MESHLGGCLLEGDIGTFAPQIWDKLIELYSIKSVMDIGCGAGHSLKYFLDHEVEGIGVEGFQGALSRSVVGNKIQKHDYTTGPYIPTKEYDLAWCCEFVEHVEEKYIDNFLSTFKKCQYAAMTHGLPGQSGYHHVNCQPAQYWIKKLEESGFDYLENDSLMLRKLLINDDGSNKPNGGHIRNTLMIFKRK